MFGEESPVPIRQGADLDAEAKRRNPYPIPARN